MISDVKDVREFIKEIQGKGLRIVESETDGALTLEGDESSKYVVELLGYDKEDVKRVLSGKEPEPDELPHEVTALEPVVAHLPQLPPILPTALGSPYILCKPPVVIAVIKSISDNQNIIDVNGVIDELEKHIIQEDFWMTVTSILSSFSTKNIEPTKDIFLTALKIIYTGDSTLKLSELYGAESTKSH